MDDELKKCPFCGGEAEMIQYYNWDADTWFVVCKCAVCNAQAKTASCGRGKPAPSDVDWDCPAVERATIRWNHRYKEGN